MQETVLITGYKIQQFTVNEKDGTKTDVDIVKVSYLTKFSGSEAFGSLPTQVTFKDRQKAMILKRIEKVPALYNMESATVPGKNNKPVTEIVDFEFVKEVDLKPLFKVS